MTTRFLAPLISDHLHRGPVGRTSVRHNDVGTAVPLHCFLEDFQGSGFVTLLRDEGFQHLALMIHCAPKTMPLASDFDEDLDQVPPPLGTASHRLGAPLPDLVSEVCRTGPFRGGHSRGRHQCCVHGACLRHYAARAEIGLAIVRRVA